MISLSTSAQLCLSLLARICHLWNLNVYIMFYFVLTNPVGIFIQGQIQTFFLAGEEMCFYIEKGRVEIKR